MASQDPPSNNPYVNDMVEKIAHCYERHEALASQIRPLSQAEQQANYNAALLEWQQPDKPNAMPTDQVLRGLFLERCQEMMDSNPTTTKE